MTTKELILALAEHVHLFGDEQVLIDGPGDLGWRVTGVGSTGFLTIVEVIEDENGVIRDAGGHLEQRLRENWDPDKPPTHLVEDMRNASS